jgi:drug/metabolite transporter (DMT)-like permease
MSRRAWAAFAAMAILWGVPYLLIRVAVVEVSPVVVSWGRLLIAAAILVPFAAGRGALLPALRRWPWLVLLGAFYMALAWTLLPLAERTLPSSLTAIVISGVPIVVTLMELPRERPSALRILGLVLGLCGVGALVGLDIGVGRSQLIALGFLLVVLVCYAAGPVLTRARLGGLDPIANAGVPAASAVVILSPLVALNWPARLPSTPVLIAIVALGLFCSAAALVVWFWLIAEVGPARAAVVPYLNPAVAVLAGALVLHERIGLGAVVGLVLILGGSYLATAARPKAPPEPAAAAPA